MHIYHDFTMCTSKGNRASVFLHILLWMWLSIHSCNGVLSDVECLKGVKAQLSDSNGYLSSWDFSNKTEGSICRFNGIECWHPDENRVLSIRLSNMGLRGRFPSALKNCTSMTGLDLSANELSGPLPEEIGRIIPFVTSLDLSSNNFTGAIPTNLSNCSYLNILRLQHNHFSGSIPWQLGQLDRLSEFSVADNALSARIPSFQNPMSESSFANNLGLCGKPLPLCRGPTKKTHTGVIVGAAIGGVLLAMIVIGAFVFYSFRKAVKTEKEKEEDLEGNKWGKSTSGNNALKVSTFKKLVSKMRLSDIMKATDNFSEDSIISCGRTGIIYKAMLQNGSLLAVKRMQNSHRSIKRFITEITLLGSIQHRNVVPLLGFCIARGERLLVYKYLPKGTLHQQLHQAQNAIPWSLRLRIAVGVARGLVWLHHHCNPCIIHRDISSKSILLDERHEPVISNFKSARLMGTVKNSVFGGAGYIAPEYERMFEAFPKGDVYSFGVVLLELITGNQAPRVANAPRNFNGNLVDWISYLSNNSRLSDAIDKSLTGNGLNIDLFEFLNVACSCVVPNPKERPTMFEVYQLLCGIGKRYMFIAEEEEIELPPNRIETEYAYLVMTPQEVQEIH